MYYFVVSENRFHLPLLGSPLYTMYLSGTTRCVSVDSGRIRTTGKFDWLPTGFHMCTSTRCRLCWRGPYSSLQDLFICELEHLIEPIIWCEDSGGIAESKLLEHKVNVHEKMVCRQVMRAVTVLNGLNGRICCYLLPDDRSLTVHGPRKNFRCHPIAFNANRMVSFFFTSLCWNIYKVLYLAPDTPTVERIGTTCCGECYLHLLYSIRYLFSIVQQLELVSKSQTKVPKNFC